MTCLNSTQQPYSIFVLLLVVHLCSLVETKTSAQRGRTMKRLIVTACCLLFTSPACNDKEASDSMDADAYYNRGVSWLDKGELDKAISDYSQAIRLDPKFVQAYTNRGIVWSGKDQLDKAIADYNEAIRLDPKNASPYNNLAWLQSTCPDARYRNGRKAVENGRKACDLTDWKIHILVGTLAAAYAENGEFDEAVCWQQKAIELAPAKYKAVYRSFFELYKVRKPLRENPKK